MSGAISDTLGTKETQFRGFHGHTLTYNHKLHPKSREINVGHADISLGPGM